MSSKERLKPETVSAIADALDAGKETSLIASFYGVSSASINRIRLFDKLVAGCDHATVAQWVHESKIGKDIAQAIMDRHAYSIPAEFKVTPPAAPAQKTADQIDYRPLLNSLMTQIATMNATLTALRDIGIISHNTAELLSSFCPSVSRDLDILKEKQAATDETINAIFQAIGGLSDRQKAILQQMKWGSNKR